MPTLRVPSTVAGLKGNAVTVQRWLKKPGESFAKGDLLVELDSHDSLLHLEATESGTLSQQLVAPGKTITLGTPIAEYSSGTAPEKSPAPAVASHPAPDQKAPMSNPASTGKATPILMPQAGNTMEEGRIVAWKVKVGDRITVGQVIAEIETDKATIEFEATDAGRIARIIAPEGAVIPVKQPIAYLAESDADVEAAVGAGASPAQGGEAVGIPVAQAHAAPAPSVAAPPAGSVVPLLMPQAGNSMEEGTVTKWRVKPGDRITVGQIIYDIDTDKASVEVESTDAGRLAKIIAPEGSVIPVKQPVAFLAENDADVDAYLASGHATPSPGTPGEGRGEGRAPVTAASSAPTPALPLSTGGGGGIAPTNGGRLKASPAARKIAAERGLDLASVGIGSGPGGRILSTDLDRASKAGAARPAAPAIPAAPGTVVRRPMSKMRRAIATNLQTSKQTVPHFYVKLTINADPLFAFYKAQKPATNCTLNDVVLLAVGKTVYDFPAFRSRIEGNDIVELPSANIGIAVSVEDGLVVPVIMGIERHTLASLPAESKRIVEAGRKGKLENVGKGVFTISNMGMLGVEDFSAIINPPESGILAISAVRESVIVKDGAMKAGRVMSMTLSVDHRVVDGALAALWMAKLKERLENPETMLS
jgi:pyruvate dehydrogenase E2 component (dihydrolipoamide acetyltransferase)